MESRAYAALAIAFLVLLTGGAAYLFYWLQAAEPEDRIYLIDSPYEVGDLHAHSEVTYKGLVVGHVKSVAFHPRDPDKVRVRIGIQRGVPITKSMFAQLGTRGLTGTNYLALKKDPEASDAALETSSSEPARIPMRRGGMSSLMAAAGRIAERVERLTEGLNQLTGEENRERAQRLLTEAEEVLAGLEELERGLQPSVDALPGILSETRAAVEDSRRLLERAQGLVAKTDREVERVGEATGEAASSVNELSDTGRAVLDRAERGLLPELEVALQRLKRSASNLESLSRRLERQPQSILFGPVEPPPGPGEPGFTPRPDEPSGESP